MPNGTPKTSNQSHKDEHFDTRIEYFLSKRENLFEVGGRDLESLKNHQILLKNVLKCFLLLLIPFTSSRMKSFENSET